MSLIRIVIFDFDGVIIESADIKIEAFEELFSKHGKSVGRKAKCYFAKHPGMYRSERIKQCYSIILNKEITSNDLEQELDNYKDLVLTKILSAPWVKGIKFFLENNRKYELYIVSAAPQDEVQFIAEKRDITRYFKGIYGGPLRKNDAIDKIRSLEDCSRKEMMFIGDAISDYHAATKSGAAFIGRINRMQKNPFPEDVETIGDIAGLERILIE